MRMASETTAACTGDNAFENMCGLPKVTSRIASLPASAWPESRRSMRRSWKSYPSRDRPCRAGPVLPRRLRRPGPWRPNHVPRRPAMSRRIPGRPPARISDPAVSSLDGEQPLGDHHDAVLCVLRPDFSGLGSEVGGVVVDEVLDLRSGSPRPAADRRATDSPSRCDRADARTRRWRHILPPTPSDKA